MCFLFKNHLLITSGFIIATVTARKTCCSVITAVIVIVASSGRETGAIRFTFYIAVIVGVVTTGWNYNALVIFIGVADIAAAALAALAFVIATV